MLSIGAREVGDWCAHPWRWAPRDFWTAEIVLDAIYTLGGGSGLPGSPLETDYAAVLYGIMMIGKVSQQVSLKACK